MSPSTASGSTTKTEVCLPGSGGTEKNVSHQVPEEEGGAHYPWLGGGGAKYSALSESLGMQIGSCADRTANGLWLGGAAAQLQSPIIIYN